MALRPAATSLLSLPSEVIERIGLYLECTADRIRLVCCSKQLWQDGRLQLSSALWSIVEEVLVSPQGARSFARWAARRRAVITELTLSVPALAEGPTATHEVVHHIYAALLQLAEGPLQCLTLSTRDATQFSSWALCRFPELTQLWLEPGRGGRIVVGTQLSRLTRLEHLALGPVDGSIHLSPGCLPAGLGALSLRCSETKLSAVLPALSAVQGLRELYLTHAVDDVLTECAEALAGSLTSLALRPAGPDSWLNRSVAAYTALRRLDASGDPFCEEVFPLHDGAFRALLPLTQLTFLSLNGWLLPSYPPELRALPALKVLHLLENAFRDPLPDWPFSGQLQELYIDLPVAVSSLGQLSKMTALTTLWAAPVIEELVQLGRQPKGYPSDAVSDMLALLPVVGRLPNLKSLVDVTELRQALEGGPGGAVEALHAVEQLLAQKPGLAEVVYDDREESCIFTQGFDSDED